MYASRSCLVIRPPPPVPERLAITPDVAPPAAPAATDGRLVIDDRNHTSVKNVYAAGDIAPGPQLAIVAAASKGLE